MLNLPRLIILGLLGGALVSGLVAHPDDPKVRDLEQPYEGPGWRAGEPPLEQGYPQQRITLQAWLPLADLNPGAVFGNDCWGYVSASGREYALMGVSNGTVVVEISDPGNPVIVERLPGPNNLWHDIKTYGDYAYAVSEGGNGIRIIDLRQVDDGIVTQTQKFQNATHNVAINTDSGRLYRCGGIAFGTFIYDLSEPDNPVRIGQWTDSYVHDAQVVTYTEGPWAGREIMFACIGSLGMQILDVTDPDAITSISNFNYDGVRYAHQCWLSPDRRYLYIGDEQDESTGGSSRTYIYNVEDLANPIDLGLFSNNGNATDHNLYTRGTLIFESNYRTGLRVFDATDPTAPVEVAYFDTYPSADGKQFNGLWSNYPYFPSGTILGSDMQRGLFIWSIEQYPLSLYLPDGRWQDATDRSNTVRVEVIANVPTAAAEAAPTLYLDRGDGFEPFAMEQVGSNAYEASLPDELCNQSVRYYFEVSSTTGITATSPVNAPTETYAYFVSGQPGLVDFDDLSLPDGWLVNADGSDTATDGTWDHGTPGNGNSEPPGDVSAFDDQCWFTGAAAPGERPNDHDVDGGRTTLVSPRYDASQMEEPAFAYWRWFSNNRGTAVDDRFTVQISNDDGASWTRFEWVRVEDPQATGGWYRHQDRIAPFLPATDAMRLRFIAADTELGSRVEAAVDDIQLIDLRCLPCRLDLDGDGEIGLFELSQVLANFGERGGPWVGDVTDDDEVNLQDLALILQQFGTTCE